MIANPCFDFFQNRVLISGVICCPYFVLKLLFTADLFPISAKKIQPEQTANPALFGKENCQRQLTERLKNILFIPDIDLKISLSYQGQYLRFSIEKSPLFT